MSQETVRASRSPLEWAAEVLGSGDEILLPVSSLWQDMQRRGIGRGMSLASFSAMLESDERFQLLEGIDYGDGDPDEQMVMEELGFWSGPGVKLASRDLSADYIAAKLRQNTENMLAALEAAWAQRPDDDPETEQQLLEILTMAQRLKHEVEEVLGQPQHEGPEETVEGVWTGD